MEALGHSSVSRSTTISPLLVSSNTAMLLSALSAFPGSVDHHCDCHAAHGKRIKFGHFPALYSQGLRTSGSFSAENIMQGQVKCIDACNAVKGQELACGQAGKVCHSVQVTHVQSSDVAHSPREMHAFQPFLQPAEGPRAQLGATGMHAAP